MSSLASGNPAFNEKIRDTYFAPTAAEARTMSVGGTAARTFFFLPGIVAAAILGTVGVFVVALFLYVTRIVRPTQKMGIVVSAR